MALLVRWVIRLGILASVTAPTIVAGPIAARTPRTLRPIESFACFYGSDHLDALSRFDLVILDAGHFTALQIARLKAHGTVVLAYVSLGETREGPRASSPGPLPEPQDQKRRTGAGQIPPYYLDKDHDGLADRNGAWGSYYVDARASAWRRHVLDETLPHLIQTVGVDGVFLDTLDTVDLYPETTDGMIALVRGIRERYPGIRIVANRGFAMIDALGPLVDGFLFECFTTAYAPSSGRSTVHSAADLAWVDATLAHIRSAGGKRGVQVLALDYEDPQDPTVRRRAVARARAAGLTYSISHGSLDRLPVESGPGRPR